ncbi:hypothetical protein RHGRI_020473 [Rhododendron griersonianum]|uniref:CBF1-interacting co-repressor CIR N-terminal domain-containing protein n=1 Tax=Rhododendron griersonianum TaxID=479676 RepID=A0AAV6JL20_9ERIC|nr:hypothetical protein RHGRI_020473 [Rhododendron griersonianum]
MGGHGGLNILPQKRWNVYNFDNREKVRKDEEAAAKEEQLKREQSRKRDTEFRIEQLRQARGLAPLVHQPSTAAPTAAAPAPPSPEPESKSKLNHINLFEGIRIFDPVEGKKEDEDRGGARKKMKVEKKKEEVRVVLPEDEKYKLGYGVAGKGVKLPWYLSQRPSDDVEREEEVEDEGGKCRVGKSSGKKTVEEMREERLKREKREKERERALVVTCEHVWLLCCIFMILAAFLCVDNVGYQLMFNLIASVIQLYFAILV